MAPKEFWTLVDGIIREDRRESTSVSDEVQENEAIMEDDFVEGIEEAWYKSKFDVLKGHIEKRTKKRPNRTELLEQAFSEKVWFHFNVSGLENMRT